MNGLEYRVRWWRAGRQGGASAIFQTLDAAQRKADRLLALDAVKADTRFADMPDLLRPPVVESRPVGPWAPLPDQRAEPSDYAAAQMEEWLSPATGIDW